MTPMFPTEGLKNRPRNLLIVDSLEDWPESGADFSTMSATDYLANRSLPKTGVRVINLCRHHEKLSLSYYISLLAEARGHRVIPSAKTLHELSSKQSYREALEELQSTIDKSLSYIESDSFVLSVYFGENLAKAHHHLARALYKLFPSPLMRFHFLKEKDQWRVQSIEQLGLDTVSESHHDFIFKQLRLLLEKRWSSPRIVSAPRYEIAILHNPLEAHPPSNRQALQKFIKAASRLGMHAELIVPKDYARLLEYDALFIRETTNLGHHTLRFAAKAEREGMIVIDDPDSIRRCCNKVYLAELMERHKIRTPSTTIIHKNNYIEKASGQSYPCVLKIPDGAFSIGIYKVQDQTAFVNKVKELLKQSSIVLVQEYLPTDYDWRIGVIDGKILYACRYYMSKGHWQIYNHVARSKGEQEGASDCVPVEEVPVWIQHAAISAAQAIGSGLYGVDLKEHNGKAYVIEVNDNPSIESGVEDELLGDMLYDVIMRSFLNRLESRHPQIRAEEAPCRTF